MKIYVNKLPTKPNECMFRTVSMNYWGHWVNRCTFSLKGGCAIADGQICPYLIEFNKEVKNPETESMLETEYLEKCY